MAGTATRRGRTGTSYAALQYQGDQEALYGHSGVGRNEEDTTALINIL